MERRGRSFARRALALAVLSCAVSCDDLRCYDDTDRPPFPPQPPTALPLDTPTATDDGEFRIVLRAPADVAWPPRASAVALVVEIDAHDRDVELTAAPAYSADDPTERGDDPDVSPEGDAAFRIASSVPRAGLWCLPVDVAAGERIDGLDVCVLAR